MFGPLWARMNEQQPLFCRIARNSELPSDPGVYAWYKDGAAIYVGKANSLLSRLRNNHLSRGSSLSNSAFRRNVAEYLGIGSAADIKAGRKKLSSEEVDRVVDFIDGCKLRWLVCESKAAALQLESEMKDEHQPPLTKR